MDKYFCIFSESGTIKSDFMFGNEEDYFSFILANKSVINWSKLIDVKTGETVDEYHNLYQVDFSKLKINIPEELINISDSLILINKQQLHWMTKFASIQTPSAFKKMNDQPLSVFEVPQKSSFYQKDYMLSGFAMLDKNELNEKINLIVNECDTNYKKRLFKLMVSTKGLEFTLS